MEVLVPLDKVIEFMKQGKCLITTDGSAGDDIIPFAWKIGDVDVYPDNEGVIDRIAKQRTYPLDYSFHTIDPDWDIIAQICDIFETMNIKLEFKHEKGHQDDNIPNKELDLPAQLNIEVDFLAINY
eukprot:11902204-Ditylum_brightwellii.AAC.1